MKTDTATLIAAMRILARDIQSGDDVANAAIGEAADRLEELHHTLMVIESRTVAAIGIPAARHDVLTEIKQILRNVLK